MVDNLQQDAHVDTCQVYSQYFLPYECLKIILVIFDFSKSSFLQFGLDFEPV